MKWTGGDNRSFGIAWAAGWAFAISFTLYAYYEDGPVAVAVFVAVRLIPAALAAPYARRLATRAPFAWSAAARALLLGAVAAAVEVDLAFPVVLALVAAFRIAGAADRWYFAAADLGFDGGAAAMRRADASRRDLEELCLLYGALAAGLGMLAFQLHTVFALCALGYAAAVPLGGVRALPRTGPLLALGSREPRHLHLVRAGRAAARAAMELLVVVVALDLLGMEDSGVAWLLGALALGLLAGARTLPPPPLPRSLTTACVLAGLPLALLALEPPTVVALGLLALLGLAFAVYRRVERGLEDSCPPDAHIEGEELVDALARTAGATVAAALVLGFGDDAAMLAAGALVALLGVGVASALDGAPATPVTGPPAVKRFRLLG